MSNCLSENTEFRGYHKIKGRQQGLCAAAPPLPLPLPRNSSPGLVPRTATSKICDTIDGPQHGQEKPKPG